MFKVADRIKESSLTAGTGSVVLNGAINGFQTFLNGIGDGNSTFYAIENESQWEVGVGTYTALTNSLSRDVVYDSSNSGNKISLVRVSTVFCTYPAGQAIYENNEGKVSIGRQTPSYQLDVLGSGRFDTIVFGDGTTQSSSPDSYLTALVASGVAISGWAKYYVDHQDHSASAVSGMVSTSYLPYSGAIKNTDIGDYSFNASGITAKSLNVSEKVVIGSGYPLVSPGSPSGKMSIFGDASDTIGSGALLSLNAANVSNATWKFRIASDFGSPYPYGALCIDSRSGSVDTNRLTINRQNGNIGIGGVINPLAGVHVIGFTPALWIANQSGVNLTKRFQVVCNSYDESKPVTIVAGQNDQNNNDLWIGGNRSDQYASTVIRFFTASGLNVSTGSERVRIDSSGNLGIGTINPTTKLDVAGTIEVKNSTNAQSLKVYNTYANAGLDYERAKIAWESNVLRIGTEGLGTGAVNPRTMEFQTAGITALTINNTSTGPSVRIDHSLDAYNNSRDILAIHRYNDATPTTKITWNGRVVTTAAFELTSYAATFIFHDGNGVIGQTQNTTYPGGTRYSPYILAYDDLELIAGTGSLRAVTLGKAFAASPAIGRLYGQSGLGTNIAGGALHIGAGKSTGTGAGGSIVFQTAPAGTTGSSVNALVDRMTIDSNGNVGIGTTSPGAKLSVISTAVGAGQFENPLYLGVSDTSDNFSIRNNTQIDGRFCPDFVGEIIGSHTARALGFIGVIPTAQDSGTNPVIAFDAWKGSYGSGTQLATRPSFAFQNYGSPLVTIMPNGNVGIGTTSPGARLTVGAGSTAATTANPTIYVNENSNSTSIVLRDSLNGLESKIIANDGSGCAFGSVTNNTVSFFVNNAPRMRIYNGSFLYNATGGEDLLYVNFNPSFLDAKLNLRLPSDKTISWGSGTGIGSASDLLLQRDAANTLAQRNGTNQQRFNLYGTYDSNGANYRRLYLDSTTAGAFTIGVEGAGTGASGNTLTIASQITYNTILPIYNPSTSMYGQIRLYGNNVSDGRSGISFEQSNNFAIEKFFGVHQTLNTGAFVWQGLNRPSLVWHEYMRLSEEGNLTITPRWNNVATTFTGILANVTDTQSASGSLLLDLQVGGISAFKVAKTGAVTLPTNIATGSLLLGSTSARLRASGNYVYLESSQNVALGSTVISDVLTIDTANNTIPFTRIVGYTNNGKAQLGLYTKNGQTVAPFLFGDHTLAILAGMSASADILQINNGTTDSFRDLALRNAYFYNSYTNASNYERAKIAWESNVLVIGTEAAGSGAKRKIRLSPASVDASSYIDFDCELYGSRISAQYGLSLRGNNDTRKSVAFCYVTNTGFPIIGNEGYSFASRCTANKTIGFDPYHSYHDYEVGTIPNLTLRGHDCYASAVTNIAGGHLYLLPGAGASASAGAANGGHVYLDGGQGYGTGVDGSIIIGNTRAGGVTMSATALSGSQATSLLSMAQTWNTTGTPTAIKLNVTEVQSNPASLLMDLQVGGTSRFSVKKDGLINRGTAFMSLGVDASNTIYFGNPATGVSSLFGFTQGNNAFQIRGNAAFAWSSGANDAVASTPDLYLYRDASGTLAQRNGASAQTFRIYKTYTDATNNFERGKIGWSGDVFQIGTEKGLTSGAARALELQTDGTTRLTIGATGDITVGTASDTKLLFAHPSGNPYITNYSNAGISVYSATGNGLGTVNCGEVVVKNTSYYYWSGRALITSSANGAVHVQNNAIDDSVNQVLCLGPGTSSTNGVRLKRATATTVLSIRNGNDSADADITAANATFSGALTATSKSFLIDHPSKPGMKLQYGSLESPYHGVRITGEGVVTSGYVKIDLPDYMCNLIKTDGINIQLTAIGHYNNMCVGEVNSQYFTVLCNSNEVSKFYWTFTAVRKDIEDLVVEIN